MGGQHPPPPPRAMAPASRRAAPPSDPWRSDEGGSLRRARRWPLIGSSRREEVEGEGGSTVQDSDLWGPRARVRIWVLLIGGRPRTPALPISPSSFLIRRYEPKPNQRLFSQQIAWDWESRHAGREAARGHRSGQVPISMRRTRFLCGCVDGRSSSLL
nr:unnamed protein product [Digitaria exilis]